jgi:hypothetical protein
LQSALELGDVMSIDWTEVSQSEILEQGVMVHLTAT